MAFRYTSPNAPIKVGSASYSSSSQHYIGTQSQISTPKDQPKYTGINLLARKLKLENGARLSDSDVAIHAPPMKRESSEIIPDGYKIDRLLGQGRYSRVYKAIDDANKLCTIKVYRHKAKQWLIENEISILKMLNCCNLIQHYIKHFSNEEETVVIMDYFEGHTLKRYITPDTMDYNLDLYSILCIALNLLRAVNFLVSVGIVHRDIKPDNLIYNPVTKETKVIDLGLATITATYDKPRVGGTPIYKPPEILINPDAYGQDPRYKNIWPKHDIWSC